MIGKSLVHYEISAEIGKGGMGEVYQAKDTKLGRDVAIKVLPEEFAMDHDRVARFQREAKLLASLNHPNIAAIHGLEESEGTHFLVMELIEGQTLKDRIKSGPIPVEEALKLALQMAEALEAAHENGVIHRDLKPANIKVTPDGKVKILDFGLAKAFSGDQENINLADSPTISAAAATQQGVILGTAAYMSPEQARGKPVDRRVDIWAFGCVLFEMLTSQAAFQGEDVTEVLAAVVKSEVNLDLLPKNIHPRVREVLTRSLQKDQKKRYRDIGESKYEIEQVLSDPSGIFAQPISTVEPRRNIRSTLALIAIAVILTAIIVGVVVWNLKTTEPPKVMRFSYELPESQRFTSDIRLAVSPDGSQFAYLTTDGFYLRSVDALNARSIAGTNRYSKYPVFSPDGKWIAYWSSNDRKVKKIAVSGGVPVVLCDTSTIVVGLSWSADNTIVYSDVMGGGVKRVSADGGTPESIIEAIFTNTGTDGMPINPQMLPDGKTLLFTNSFSPRNMADRQITIQSLESGERKVLVGGIGIKYLPSGHLIYAQINNNITNIVAALFDLDTLEVKGGPVPLLEGVEGAEVSDTGTLVYVLSSAMSGQSGSGTEASATPGPGRTLWWVDRKGSEEQIQADPHMYYYPKISPDGTKLALSATISNNTDVWILDLIRGTLSRLTFDDGADYQAVWTPDGKRIAYASINSEQVLAKGGISGIVWKAADGTGTVELLGISPGKLLFPYSWTPDATILVTGESGIDIQNFDIGMISTEGDRPYSLLLKEDYFETQPQLSPDGRWLAYSSGESEENQIFVRPFPDVDKGGRWQISTSGGNSPRWSPDGKELFYLIGGNIAEVVMRVAIETEPAFNAGKPEVLFRGKYIGTLPDNGTPYDVHPDGNRFLMMKGPETTGEETTVEEPVEVGPREIIVVTNWDEELKKRVPVD